jgi:hypothetical protein
MHEVKRDLLPTGRCIAVAVLHILNFGIALSKDKTGGNSLPRCSCLSSYLMYCGVSDCLTGLCGDVGQDLCS